MNTYLNCIHIKEEVFVRWIYDLGSGQSLVLCDNCHFILAGEISKNVALQALLIKQDNRMEKE